eukprot:Sdes_comp20235_c0_seq2m13627
MLRPKVLSQVLSQANSSGIKHTILLNYEGSVLSYSGEACNDGKVVAAISSNIWQLYESSGRSFLNDDELEYVIIECDEGRLVVTKVSKLLLCLFSDPKVEFGMLKAKAEKLVQYLEPQLDQIM